MAEFETYQARKITYEGLEEVDGWQVKLYTISQRNSFQAVESLQAVQTQLDGLLALAYQSALPLHQHAFVIVHEAREGIWVLLNWWTGGEMLETMTRFISPDTPTELLPSPHTGPLICIWELEVVWHERMAWISHVLSKAANPDFRRYQTDVLGE